MSKISEVGGEMDKSQVLSIDQRVTWETSGRSVLKFNTRILYFLGLWNLNGTYTYTTYTIFLSLVWTGTFLTNVAGIGLSGGNMEVLVMAIVCTLAMMSGFGKACMLFWRKAEFENLVNRLDRHVIEQSRFCENETSLQKILREAHRNPLVLMCVTGVYFTILAIQWAVTPLVANDGSKTLPYNQLPWVAKSSMGIYYLHYVQQICTIPYCGSITFAFEFFFLSVMINTSGQFRILHARLRNLGKYGKKGEEVVTEKSFSDQQLIDAYEELCRCIETHQELLRYVEFLDKMMSPYAMLQFIVGTLSVCVVLFQATDSQVRSSNLKCAAWLPGPGMQLFIYCLGAHQVSEQGEAVAEAAYGSPWVNASPRVRQAVRIIMTRSQTPPVLTAGHLYPISRATFVSLVNAAYSYYALLRQINSR